MDKLEKFRALGLSEDTINALIQKGFEEPTAIQEKTIPLLMKEKINLIGQAQTGTGKTAAFGLPMIETLKPNQGYVQALILVPTRELALQVSEEISSLKGKHRLHIAPIYGGQSFVEQLRRLKQGIDIVVGTPGRILDHLDRGTLVLSDIRYLILDEADEMLNMGFIEDVEKIMAATPENKRVLLFSATMPDRIRDLAKKYMGEYKLIKVETAALTTDLTDQIYFEVRPQDKFEALTRIIDISPDFYGLVFCRTRLDAAEVAAKLVERGYAAEALHGDISQDAREKILERFKAHRITILVATDVAARGIDISNLSHVINYSLPQNPEAYVHRIGRTGRAGKEGVAITFVTPDEYRKLLFIKRVAGKDIRREKVPGVEQVIEARKSKIREEVFALTEKEESLTPFRQFAIELLEEQGPVALVSALLKLSFNDELDASRYHDIYDLFDRKALDRSGKTRLFVALGKSDGYTPKALINMISERCKISEKRIHGLTMFDRFSFITVPFEDAERIIEAFKARKKGERTLVRKANEKESDPHEKGEERQSRPDRSGKPKKMIRPFTRKKPSNDKPGKKKIFKKTSSKPA